MNPQQNKSSIAGKVVLSLGLIIVSVIYGAWQNNRNQEALITPAQQSYKPQAMRSYKRSHK